MNLGEHNVYIKLFAFLVMLLVSCHKESLEEEKANEQGRKNKSYVSTLMVQYVAPSESNENRVPPPPLGWSYLTIGATYKGDTLRILLNTVKELVSLSEIADSPVDSASIASLVKGDSFLKLSEGALKEAYVIKPSASIDSVRSHGEDYFLKHYFNKNGRQKKSLNFPEQAYLIDALSDLGLLISKDDYNGFYYMTEPYDDY